MIQTPKRSSPRLNRCGNRSGQRCTHGQLSSWERTLNKQRTFSEGGNGERGVCVHKKVECDSHCVSCEVCTFASGIVNAVRNSIIADSIKSDIGDAFSSDQQSIK